jgi:hypothetical protein
MGFIEFTTTVVGADMVVIVSSPPLSNTVLGFDLIQGPSCFIDGSSLIFEIVTLGGPFRR